MDTPAAPAACFCAICGGPFTAVSIKKRPVPKVVRRSGGVSTTVGSNGAAATAVGDEEGRPGGGGGGDGSGVSGETATAVESLPQTQTDGLPAVAINDDDLQQGDAGPFLAGILHGHFEGADETSDDEGDNDTTPTGAWTAAPAQNHDSDFSDDDIAGQDDGSDHDSIDLSDVEEEGNDSEGNEDDDDDDDDPLFSESEGEENNTQDSAPDVVLSSDVDWTSSDSEEDDDDNQPAQESSEDEGDATLEGSYDGNIITQHHANWLQVLYVLGFNPKSPHESKTFLSGFGGLDITNPHSAFVTPGPLQLRDKNYPRSAAGRRTRRYMGLYTAASGSGNDEPSNFPFHMPCIQLLCQNLTSIACPCANSTLNKDVLYFSLLSLCEFNPQALMVNYGEAEPSMQYKWACRNGYEWVVSHPRINTRPRAVMSLLLNTLAHVQGRYFVEQDLSAKVRTDPFGKLPYDLIYRLSNFLSDRDLFALSTASWSVHLPLRTNNQFWRYRVRNFSMPWFEEAFGVLREIRRQTPRQHGRGVTEGETNDNSQDEYPNKDWKGILCSLNELLVSEKGRSGVLMGIKNRRRIWEVCRVIGREYFTLEKEWRERGSEETVEKFGGLRL
ncbi:hypothetical protein QBC35DRAFT_219008 [Podospora australis]|uniref:F-box domain-containing protein n=1 Tax=Podospora australis TaxID=1536484 RepID=A0AAN7AJ34_9PEZI|nr:hypothetical protein QBC35DRAFT_219008 [Podospora australis]